METTQIGNHKISIQNYPPEHLFENQFPIATDTTPTCQHGVTIETLDNQFSIILNGFEGATGIHKNSFVVNQTNIYICVSNTIFCLDLDTLNVIWHTKVDQVTCFGVYLVKDHLIVHGEISISSISLSGKINWQQSGEDIFTTIDGKEDFEIKEELIQVKDFNNKKYKINLQGEFL